MPIHPLDRPIGAFRKGELVALCLSSDWPSVIATPSTLISDQFSFVPELLSKLVIGTN